jgi:AcrR family transcriptional regulator
MVLPATKVRTARAARTDEVLQVAIEVFAAEGFHGADVQVIADRAGVGKGTIYRHFGDKAKLFLAAARHALEQVGRSVEQARRPGRGTADFLRDIATGCARYYSAHPGAVELIVQERALFREDITPTHLLRRTEGQHGVEAELRRGIDRGELRPVDVRATYEAFGDLLFGSVVNGVLAGEAKSLVGRVEQAVDLFLVGIVSDESKVREERRERAMQTGDRPGAGGRAEEPRATRRRR